MESTNFPLEDVLMVCEVCRLAWLAQSTECVYTIWPTEWYSFVIHILETNCWAFCSGQGFSRWVVCVWLHRRVPIVILHGTHTSVENLFIIYTTYWSSAEFILFEVLWLADTFQNLNSIQTRTWNVCAAPYWSLSPSCSFFESKHLNHKKLEESGDSNKDMWVRGKDLQHCL